jgi:hypothetical protein
MQVTVMANPRARHQIVAAEALCDGLKAEGYGAIYTHSRSFSTKKVACWGWRNGLEFRRRGHDVLVIEHGYIGDRDYWLSLGWNGLNNRAKFPEIDDISRFDSHFSMQPWRQSGDYVLIMGQVPGDMSLAGRDLTKWYAEVAKDAERLHQMPVFFRPHPVCVDRGMNCEIPGIETLICPMDEALDGAHLVIAWNSNATVESVLSGIPCLTFDRGAMAWDVTGHQVRERIMPDREVWASRLAWKQWSLEEISTGAAVGPIMEALC